MKPVLALLGLVLLLDTILAAEESCVERCGSFNRKRKCQCDSMCVYYGSCCDDFDTICPKKNVRGDTFAETEEVTETVNTPTSETTTTFTPTFDTVVATTPASPPTPTTAGPATIVDPDAVPCSARPFDAFLQLKNGSIYAFRGEYFFELDDKSILPGNPKLIQDVWGLSGPIDAAFTRINCQGKSYLFKGNQYWRFDGDVLDEDYPRNISVGFDDMPEDIDAAFTVPAPNHLGREKAYFFKGDKYYQYNFKHQPSHEECFHMSRSSPSLLFTEYTDLFCDQTWEDWFTELFGSSVTSRLPGPRLTGTDWHGIRVPVDAAMLGQVRLSPKPISPPPMRKRNKRRRTSSKKRSQRRQRDPYMSFYDVVGFDDMFEFLDHSDSIEEEPTWVHKGENGNPVQNVYFFRRDKYYRVNLQTKHVDSARPPYPRSIAKYWLGCKDEEAADTSRSEKR